MPTEASDKEALTLLARRFAWMTVALYVILIAGFAVAHAIFPDRIGSVDAYVLTTSLIGAVTFGGLYAAATALRPARTEDQPTTGTH